MPSMLARLHSIRIVEEQEKRTAMDLAMSNLGRLREAAAANDARTRQARLLISRSINNGDLEERHAGQQELMLASRTAKNIADLIEAADQALLGLREQYLAKRVERRQVEALLKAEREKLQREETRRAQFQLDEWFRSHSPRQRDIR